MRKYSQKGRFVDEKSYLLFDFDNETKKSTKLKESKMNFSERISQTVSQKEHPKENEEQKPKPRIQKYVQPDFSKKDGGNDPLIHYRHFEDDDDNNLKDNTYHRIRQSTKIMKDKQLQTSLYPKIESEQNLKKIFEKNKNNNLEITKNDNFVYFGLKDDKNQERVHINPDSGEKRKESSGQNSKTSSLSDLKFEKPKSARKVGQMAKTENILDSKKTNTNKKEVEIIPKIGLKPLSAYHFEKIDIPISAFKKSITPINKSPPKNTHNFGQKTTFHQVCKEPESDYTSRPKSVKRSSNSPKFRQEFFDKHPDFCVKQYQKLVGGETGKGQPNKVFNNSFEPERHQNLPNVDHFDKSKTQKILTKPVCTCPTQNKKQQLLNAQFCGFCDNYMHPECFDKFFGR